MKRCVWAQGSDELIREYHDNEYGRRKKSDTELFEKLCLEAFQAGLSWRTVLIKRDALREWFFGFDVRKVAQIEPLRIEDMMSDERIIRNRRKIEAVVHNARMQQLCFPGEGDFVSYVYSFSDKDELCADLKKKGYKFVGGNKLFFI
jgi:DNA-3-methyladenine glycosylase I